MSASDDLCFARCNDNKSAQSVNIRRQKNGEIDLRNFRYSPKSGKLTRTKFMVAQMVCCGLADKEICSLLGIAPQTVKFHVSQTMRIIGVKRRTQLVRYMFESNLFDPDWASEELKSYLADKAQAASNLTTFSRSSRFLNFLEAAE